MTASDRNEERKHAAFEAIARARALLDESEDDEAATSQEGP